MALRFYGPKNYSHSSKVQMDAINNISYVEEGNKLEFSLIQQLHLNYQPAVMTATSHPHIVEEQQNADTIKFTGRKEESHRVLNKDALALDITSRFRSAASGLSLFPSPLTTSGLIM